MMATVPHVISGLELRKFQADGFFFDTSVHIYAVSEFVSNKLVPLWKVSEWLVSFLYCFFGSPDYNAGKFKR